MIPVAIASCYERAATAIWPSMMVPVSFAHQPTALAAAGRLGDAGRAALAIGRRADVALIRTVRVRYAAPPGKPGEPTSYGGLVSVNVPAAATYRVALGAGAWIDVLAGTAPVASTAHGHGPACSGIRKMVDFRLGPGRYTLQIAGSRQPTLAVLVARLP